MLCHQMNREDPFFFVLRLAGPHAISLLFLSSFLFGQLRKNLLPGIQKLFSGITALASPKKVVVLYLARLYRRMVTSRRSCPVKGLIRTAFAPIIR